MFTNRTEFILVNQTIMQNIFSRFEKEFFTYESLKERLSKFYSPVYHENDIHYIYPREYDEICNENHLYYQHFTTYSIIREFFMIRLEYLLLNEKRPLTGHVIAELLEKDTFKEINW